MLKKRVRRHYFLPMREKDVIQQIEYHLQKYWKDSNKVHLPHDDDFRFLGFQNLVINEDRLLQESNDQWSFSGELEISRIDHQGLVATSGVPYTIAGRCIINPIPCASFPSDGEELMREYPDIDKIRVITLKEKPVLTKN